MAAVLHRIFVLGKGFSMSPEQLLAAIDVTIGDIDDEIAGIAPLVALARHRPLDFIETAAASQIIQSMYTGIESLMLLVAKKSMVSVSMSLTGIRSFWSACRGLVRPGHKFFLKIQLTTCEHISVSGILSDIITRIGYGRTEYGSFCLECLISGL